MKKMLFILLIGSLLYAQKVEITADKLEANEKSRVSMLIGHVKIKKGKDEIYAGRLKVKFDKKNKPSIYEADGGVKFHIITDTKEFKGRGQRLVYNPKTLKYEIMGYVIIEELNSNQKLYGEKISIDRISGKSLIEGGDNRPIKFIFDVKE